MVRVHRETCIQIYNTTQIQNPHIHIPQSDLPQYFIINSLNCLIYNLTVLGVSTITSCPGIGAIAHIPPVIVATEVVYPANCTFTRVRNYIKYIYMNNI